MKKSQLKQIIKAIIKEALDDKKNVTLPPETPTDNYELFTKKLQNTGYLIPSKEDIVSDLISRYPTLYKGKSWSQLADAYLSMYRDFAQYGTNEGKVLSEAGISKFVVNGVPISFSFSSHQNHISIHIHRARRDTRVPINIGSMTMYRPSGSTNIGNHFYLEEAKKVEAGLKKKFGVKHIKWVEQEEYNMDYENNKYLGKTGKQIYWLVIEWADDLLRKLFAKALQSP